MLVHLDNLVLGVPYMNGSQNRFAVSGFATSFLGLSDLLSSERRDDLELTTLTGLVVS